MHPATQGCHTLWWLGAWSHQGPSAHHPTTDQGRQHPNSSLHSTFCDAVRRLQPCVPVRHLHYQDGSKCLNTYLQTLAWKLNSNQDFSPDDSFTMETTFIHMPSPGSGHGKKQHPGREAMETLLAARNQWWWSKTGINYAVCVPSWPWKPG